MTRTFKKPSLTISDQIRHLQQCGMNVADPLRAEHWLSHVSYYRLSGYWHIYKDRRTPHGTRFLPGADFDTVCELYNFDRKLRRLVGRGVEHFEVALRGSWAYALAHRGGPHGYLNAALYSKREEFHRMLAKLASDAGSSSETYIQHYRATYDEPPLPAAWMAAEMMSFGQLSRWYSLLNDTGLRSTIAQPFGLRQEQLVSIVKHMVDIRNICAHHGRLWNRGFRSPPQLPRNPNDLAQTLDTSRVGNAAGSVYNSLVLLIHLVRAAAPQSTWRDDLRSHLETHPTGNFGAMGFPIDWKLRPLWT
jgi:abortive infection bacteriophage resistance protein